MYFHLEITYKSVNTTPLNFPLLNQNPYIHIHIVVSKRLTGKKYSQTFEKRIFRFQA